MSKDGGAQNFSPCAFNVIIVVMRPATASPWGKTVKRKRPRPKLTSFNFLVDSKHLGLEVKPDGRVMAVADECANLMAPGESPYDDAPKQRGPITAIPVVSCTNERPLAGLTPIVDALAEFNSLLKAPALNDVVPPYGFACAMCGEERVFEAGTIGFHCWSFLMVPHPPEIQ